jgi:hypothetical protein
LNQNFPVAEWTFKESTPDHMSQASQASLVVLFIGEQVYLAFAEKCPKWKERKLN